MAKGMATSS